MKLIIFVTLLFIGCDKVDQDYNFTSKVLLSVKDVEALELEFENILDNKSTPNDLKYFEVAIRYKDTRVIPYLKWVFSIGNEHLKSLSVYTIGEIGGTESVRFLKEIQVKNQGIIQEYINNALYKLGQMPNLTPLLLAFDTIPILDKRTYIKEPFLFKDIVLDGYSLNINRVDSSSENTSIAEKIYAPTIFFRDSLLDTPTINNFWYDVGNSYHSGLDNSWDWPGLPIYASMTGKVKLIWLDLTWGLMVAIESIHKDEYITQIYGHMANEMTVKIGDYIKGGELLGFVGKSMTVTNGGYRAHLHFGLERCHFNLCDLSGYHINKEQWYNPLTFIPN